MVTLPWYASPFISSVNGADDQARLVGVPCGVAVRLILDGVLTKPGVHAPYDEEVSLPSGLKYKANIIDL